MVQSQTSRSTGIVTAASRLVYRDDQTREGGPSKVSQPHRLGWNTSATRLANDILSSRSSLVANFKGINYTDKNERLRISHLVQMRFNACADLRRR